MGINESFSDHSSRDMEVETSAYNNQEKRITPMSGKSFEYLSKDTRVNMRMPAELLAAVKAASEKKGIKYQHFVRLALEDALEKASKD